MGRPSPRAVPSFPPPRSSEERATSPTHPYRKLEPRPSEPAAEARVTVSRPEEPSGDSELPPKNAKPTYTKDEIRALLAVSGTPRSSAGGSPWRNPRVIAFPLGPVVWLARTWLPTPVMLVLIAGYALLFAAEVRRLARGKNHWY
jgi:hypothetical protein